MILTREQALEYHRQMWRDMQKDLGDRPDWDDRMFYKLRWCEEKFPKESIWGSCFLCEYALQTIGSCKGCPIDWGSCEVCCRRPDAGKGIDWRTSAISEILALPEKEETNVDNGM